MSDTLEMKVRRLLLRKGIEFDPSIEQIVDATACVLGHRTEPSPPAQPSGEPQKWPCSHFSGGVCAHEGCKPISMVYPAAEPPARVEQPKSLDEMIEATVVGKWMEDIDYIQDNLHGNNVPAARNALQMLRSRLEDYILVLNAAQASPVEGEPRAKNLRPVADSINAIAESLAWRSKHEFTTLRVNQITQEIVSAFTVFWNNYAPQPAPSGEPRAKGPQCPKCASKRVNLRYWQRVHGDAGICRECCHSGTIDEFFPPSHVGRPAPVNVKLSVEQAENIFSSDRIKQLEGWLNEAASLFGEGCDLDQVANCIRKERAERGAELPTVELLQEILASGERFCAGVAKNDNAVCVEEVAEISGLVIKLRGVVASLRGVQERRG